MSLPNKISKTRLMPMLAASGVCLVVLASGCCGFYGGGCGVGGPTYGPIVDAGCGDPGCDDPGCGPGAYRNCGGLRNLLSPLFHPRLGCGSGCGEIYWNEWACDPPDCCDPCDGAGCYVGPQVHHGPPLIASAIHFVGRGVSDLLGAILGGIGCGPCALLDCGGCGACGSCSGGAMLNSVHTSGCGGGCGAGCATSHVGDAIFHEGSSPQHLSVVPDHPQTVHTARNRIRSTHGRPPHRVFTRSIR